ncbi:hypothetical protein AAC387_Pa01g0959 [Persea americana]
MAFGKNPRPGKRPSSSSSSSYLSTATTIGFIALCLLGVWMITSSSIIPAQSTTTSSSTTPSRFSTRFSKFVTVDPPPISAFEEDATNTITIEKPSSDLVEKASSGRRSGGTTSDGAEILEDTNTDDNNKNNSSNSDDNSNVDKVEKVEEDQEKKEEEEEKIDNPDRKEENLEPQMPEKEENPVIHTILDSDENQQLQEQQLNQKEESEESKSQSPEQSEVKNEENQLQFEQQSEKENANGQIKEQSQSQQQQQSEITEIVEKEDQNQNNDQNQDQDQSQQQQQEEEEEKQQTASGNDENQQQQQFDQGGDGETNYQIPQHSDENGPQSQINEDSSTTTTSTSTDDRDIDEGSISQKIQQSIEKLTDQTAIESFPDEARSEIAKGEKGRKGWWSTQADQSNNEKERRQESSMYGYSWELCNVTAGPDYIPCLDNEKALKKIRSTRHFQHRERHCPDENPSCLVPIPEGYKRSIEWPNSRDKIWYTNVPNTKLAEVKGHQNWVKVTGEHLTFPGGGTQFIHGALHYIDFIQQSVPKIAWGKHTRVVLDVGCGVASFGGYLFERDVLTMSFAPKDEHEAQVQFALERGIPAISAVMGSQRLPFPSRVFDIVHCARCRVPWHAEGGTLLLELNRVLRPGGYFVWSATPVYQKLPEDVEIWKEMTSLTQSMCWDLVTIKKDKLNSVAAAIYRKPVSNDCYKNRKHNSPPMCKDDDDPNAAWYVPLQSCMHRVPVASSVRGSQWPKDWPLRLQVPPYWLNNTQVGVYGKPAPSDFVADYRHWKRIVSKSYLSGLGISWSNVRNVMDMRAVYGGFAAALNDLKVWVMNVVNIDSPDTLPIIYERGLFGIYHDWCEGFSTYPRTYDLLHADHLFSNLKKRCKIAPVMAEVDRIVRPGGKLIVRDESNVVGEVENLLKSLHWEVRLTFSKNQVAILSAQKSDWRPVTFSAYS